MYREYAIEPQLLVNNRQIFSHFIAIFGWDKGRLISSIPADWCGEVRDLLFKSDAKDIERHRIIERLRNVKQNWLIRRKELPYDPVIPWLDNIVSAHGKKNFSGIIVGKNPHNYPDVTVGMIDESDKIFNLFHGDRKSVV
mgnify:CR=1 FL=1